LILRVIHPAGIVQSAINVYGARVKHCWKPAA
jgi:hypothetical protein